MKEKYIEDLTEIKAIMNRSSRFISLSGLSGVSTGVTALAGALIAYKAVFEGQEYLIHNNVEIPDDHLIRLMMIACGTPVVSIVCAILFTTRKTKKQNEPVWDFQTKRLLTNLAIPLVAGGLLCLMLLFRGYVGFLPSITLIFYGMALVNGSKYTFREIGNLGIIQIVLGLLAFHFVQYGLLFWAAGFGVVQMVYGLIIQKKYS